MEASKEENLELDNFIPQALAQNHYRPERRSLRAKRGSGSSWQPRRVWLGSHNRKSRHFKATFFASFLAASQLAFLTATGAYFVTGGPERNLYLRDMDYLKQVLRCVQLKQL